MNFLICDMDHTMSTFDDKAGMAKLSNYLISYFDESFAQRICLFMDRCYAAFHARARGEYSKDTEKLEQLIKDASQDIEGIENFSDVHWSRELWIHIAAAGSLSPASWAEAAGYFWQGIATHTRLYEDVEHFFDSPWWQNSQWQLVLVTSSDARLYADGDQLVYDPEYSDQKKRERILPRLLHESGNNLFVGDPISKPHPDFWRPVLTNIGHEQKSVHNGHGADIIVIVGDSYRVDIEGVRPWGGLPFLIDREFKTSLKEVPEAAGVIRSFAILPRILNRLEKEKL